jgi:hypothetical protein
VKLTTGGRRLRVFTKRFLYSQLALRDSLMILFGRGKPLVQFKVEASPPSAYYNFEIRADQLEAFERELDLPYPVTPLRCLEGEEPFYCLTLNMYLVSGLARGIRAEWSTYIRDAHGVTRYMVVEARGSHGAIDPDRMITRGEHCTHEVSGNRLVGEVDAEAGGRFRIEIDALDGGRPVKADPEWIEANDYIYWRSGICDRTFYDSGLAKARARLLDNANAKIQDSTSWAKFIDPNPKHVIVFEDAIEFAMSPWWNLDDLKPGR